MQPLDLLLLALATWSGAYLLTKEDAPFKLMARFRSKTTLGGLLSCLYCAAFWVALILVSVWYFIHRYPIDFMFAVYVLAVRGAGLMLASYSGANHPPQAG